MRSRNVSAASLDLDRAARRSAHATLLAGHLPVRTSAASDRERRRRPHRPRQPAEQEPGRYQRVTDAARHVALLDRVAERAPRAPARRTRGSSRTSATRAPHGDLRLGAVRDPDDRREHARVPAAIEQLGRASGRQARRARGSRGGRPAASKPRRERREHAPRPQPAVEDQQRPRPRPSPCPTTELVRVRAVPGGWRWKRTMG